MMGPTSFFPRFTSMASIFWASVATYIEALWLNIGMFRQQIESSFLWCNSFTCSCGGSQAMGKYSCLQMSLPEPYSSLYRACIGMHWGSLGVAFMGYWLISLAHTYLQQPQSYGQFDVLGRRSTMSVLYDHWMDYLDIGYQSLYIDSKIIHRSA